MEGSRRRMNFRTFPECHQRLCHFCLARSNLCPKVSPEHLESPWELSWLTHLCHQVASSGMVERGEKKRSPGQVKERKKGKTINVMLHRAQSLKSFSWWCLVWNFTGSWLVSWAALKSSSITLKCPMCVDVPNSLTVVVRWENEAGGRVATVRLEQVGKTTAAWSDLAVGEAALRVCRRGGRLCVSFFQQSFSENGAWGWNDAKY